MSGRLNFFSNAIGRFLAIAIIILIAPSAQAQFFKKSKQKTDPAADYAYKTHSTLGKKDRIRGYGGNEAKFHFEKPKQAQVLAKASTSVSNTHFGHRRHPVRRAIGNTKLCRVCGIKH